MLMNLFFLSLLTFPIGIYFALIYRGLRRVFITIVSSIPAGFVLGYLAVIKMCENANSSMCGIEIVGTIPIGVVVAFYVFIFLPYSIFKPIARFGLGAGIAIIIMFTPSLSRIFDYWWIIIISGLVSWIITMKLDIIPPPKKIVIKKKNYEKSKPKPNPIIQNFLDGNRDSS